METNTKYTTENILRIAKRFQNKKRSYLLVNALQAKHMPCSPSASLDMMRTFGEMLAKTYPNTKLIISFAETATAIGAAVASCFAPDCIYVHTTREQVDAVSAWIDFLEEHSHATEQKLCADNLQFWLENTETVIFVEDEISTGKTLVNMMTQLIAQYPILKEKKCIAASIFNRVSAENQKCMEKVGLDCAYLLKLPEIDYTDAVNEIQVTEAKRVADKNTDFHNQMLDCQALYNPRKGVMIQHYIENCRQVADTAISAFMHNIKPNSNILVLGTEECMFPALFLGAMLERQNCGFIVKCHATTRSPIGICTNQDYPIVSGCKLKSFYAENRDTYIYNVAEYDVVIVVSDTELQDLVALKNIMGAFTKNGYQQFYYVQGGKNVWYI